MFHVKQEKLRSSDLLKMKQPVKLAELGFDHSFPKIFNHSQCAIYHDSLTSLSLSKLKELKNTLHSMFLSIFPDPKGIRMHTL